MDNIPPTVNEGNGNDAIQQSRRSGPPPFKNQVEGPAKLNRQSSRPIMEAEVSRSELAAREAVGQLIWNQPPQPQNIGPTPIVRLSRSDRVHGVQQRHAAPLFQAEYSYSSNNPQPYIRDEEGPSDAESTPPRRQVNKKNDRKPQPVVATQATKSRFGFSISTILVVIQCIIIFLFGLFVTYDEGATAIPKAVLSSTGISVTERPDFNYHTTDPVRLQKFYPFYQDVHVMIFVGFGFLMTFLKKYGYSAVGYNMLIASIAIQWSILCRGIFRHGLNTIPINVENLINADFAAGAVLISFGALLGVTNPLHLVTLCLIEVFLYALNEYIGTQLFAAVDIGGSMFIHAFGAYFGLALSLTLRRQGDIDTKNEGSSYNSDIFAMIGTIFLWLFWPSFNGVMAVGDDQHRAVLNTVLSLSGSCVVSFAASSLMCPGNKFSMVHVQNASLAGGVAVGAVADLMIQPFGALVIGSLAGLISTAGYVYLTPLLQKSIGLHDTCGVHNLHGMPGMLGGLIGVIMAALATEDMYGRGLYTQYPARAPLENSVGLKEMVDELSSIEPGKGRSAQTQALFQLAALGTTVGIAIVGGAVTGLILRIPLFEKVPNEVLFDDANLWELPDSDAQNPELETVSYGAMGITNMAMESTQNKRE